MRMSQERDAPRVARTTIDVKTIAIPRGILLPGIAVGVEEADGSTVLIEVVIWAEDGEADERMVVTVLCVDTKLAVGWLDTRTIA
jgi:hypothetical protein